jgi:polyphenol oxidase
MNFLEVGAWKTQKNILHGFGVKNDPGEKFTRQDWKGNPVVRQGKFLPIFSLKQVHGDGIEIFRGTEQEAQNFWEREGDAILTCASQVAIGVFTADCLPILLFHPEKKVIAIVHAGWRGTRLGIAAKVVEKMAEAFECPTEEIETALGPCIGPCCYEVDEPVREAFRGIGLPWQTFSSPRRPGKWSLDLQKANSFILEKAGVNKKNIRVLDYCTACCPDLFFSHRKEKGTRGRHLNFIALL